MAKQAQFDTSRPTTRRKVVSATARRSGTSSMPAIPWRIPLGKTNYMILGAGIAVIILGYILMATGNAPDPVNNAGVWDNAMAVTIAPIVLVLGYCVIIPFGIFFRRKGEDGDAGDVIAE
jgi:hypothetical protein